MTGPVEPPLEPREVRCTVRLAGAIEKLTVAGQWNVDNPATSGHDAVSFDVRAKGIGWLCQNLPHADVVTLRDTLTRWLDAVEAERTAAVPS